MGIKIYFLLSILLMAGVSAELGETNFKVITTGEEWTPTKISDEEANLTFWTANAKDKKTELGWIPKGGSCSGFVDKELQYSDGTDILDDKNKPIKLKCESGKCDGESCYHISLTDAQSVNIDTDIKLGATSYAVEYQNLSMVNYIHTTPSFDNETNITSYDYDYSCNVTLYMNSSDGYVIRPQKIEVDSSNGDFLKYMATVYNTTEDGQYMYETVCDQKIFEYKGDYFIGGEVKVINLFFAKIAKLVDTNKIDNEDICVSGANCSFGLSHEINNITGGTLSSTFKVEFTAFNDETKNTTFIDPAFSITDSQWTTNVAALFNNTNVSNGIIVLINDSLPGTFTRIIPLNETTPAYLHNFTCNATGNLTAKFKISNETPKWNAKSVIFDIADNHGDTGSMGIREIDFYLSGNKITMNDALSTSYATTFVVTLLEPFMAFDTSLSLTGTRLSATWRSLFVITNQRLIIVFDTPLDFDEIRVNNYHNDGGDTDKGVNNVKITISDDAITDTTYNAAISNDTLIYDGVFREHVAVDIADPETLNILVNTSSFGNFTDAYPCNNNTISLDDDFGTSIATNVLYEVTFHSDGQLDSMTFDYSNVSVEVGNVTNVTLINPEDNYQSQNNTVIFQFNISDNDTEEITWELYIDDIVNNTGIINATPIFQTISVTVSGLTKTTHTWYVTGSDESTTTSETRTFNITNIAPIITVHSPLSITYTSASNPSIYFNATANEAIDTWIINYNGTNITIAINTTLEVEEGSHHLLFYGNDSFGNWGLNDSIFFTVDLVSDNILELCNIETGNCVINFTKEGGGVFSDNVKLNNNSLVEVDTIVPVIDDSIPEHQEGLLYYENGNDKTWTIMTEVDGVSNQIGQETWIRGKNDEGDTIENGKAVYINGGQGGRPTFKLGCAFCKPFANIIGITTHDIGNQNNGYVTTQGLVRNITYLKGLVNENDQIYASTFPRNGNLTNVIPMFPHFNILMGVITDTSGEGVDLLVTPNRIDVTEEVVVEKLGSRNGSKLAGMTQFYDLDIGVAGDYNLTETLNIDGNDGSINFNNWTITEFNNNPLLNGVKALGFYTTRGGTSDYLPHFVLNPGGTNQTTVIARSFLIANEEVNCLNNSNATDAFCYAREGGFNWSIDFSTSITGADLGVTDDLEVIGDVYLRDTDNEVHFMTRELELSDEMKNNILISRINSSIISDTLHITEIHNKTLAINIDEYNYFNDVNDSIALTTGTNTTPAFNHIYYTDGGTATLTKSTTAQDDVADVAQILMGASGNEYGGFVSSATTHTFIRGVYHRLYDEGALYIDGFDINATSTEFNFTSGIMKIILTTETTTKNYSSASTTHIHTDGEFDQINSLDGFNQYGGSEAIGNNKYFNVVCGIVHTQDHAGRTYCTVQNKPTSEYTKIIDAEIDTDNTIRFFPNNDFIKKIYVPVARFVMKNTGGTVTIETLSNGELWFDVRGSDLITSGVNPSPGITVHSDLSNLNWSVAGHEIDENLNMSGYNLTVDTIFAKAINISNSSFFFTDDENKSINYLVENKNNGSNATALTITSNDVGGIMGVGIGSSNYILGNMLKPNITGLFSRSQGETIFANFFNRPFVWYVNPLNDNDPNNLVEVMRLDENGLNVNGSINQTNGNLTGNLIYGELWLHDELTVDLTSVNVYVNITDLNSTWNNGFAYDGNATLTAQMRGVYETQWHIAFGGGANSEYDAGIGINGVITGTINGNNMNKTHAHRTIGTGGQVGSMSGGGNLCINNGDKITMMMSDERNPVQDSTILTLQLNLNRIGDC